MSLCTLSFVTFFLKKSHQKFKPKICFNPHSGSQPAFLATHSTAASDKTLYLKPNCRVKVRWPWQNDGGALHIVMEHHFALIFLPSFFNKTPKVHEHHENKYESVNKKEGSVLQG